MAGNTPFRRWKREVHQGGIADPCIVSWPAGVPSDGSVRRQFAHAIDIVPTILDLIGIEPPHELAGVVQSPIEGVSFAPVLAHPDEPETHTTQYFEMLGSRGIYHRGWKAVTFHAIAHLYDDGLDPNIPFDEDRWELYYVAEDPSELDDLAAAEPERLRSMIALWWQEAHRYQVLPLDNRIFQALLDPRHSPGPEPSCATGVAARGAHPGEPGRERAEPPAFVDRTGTGAPGGAEGILVAMGTVLGGWSFHLLGGGCGMSTTTSAPLAM